MNCEQAEDILSAYLDDILEPAERGQLEAHLADCSACRTELAEYRSLDQMLVAAPRVSPPDELHARIFESDEFARLMRKLEGTTNSSSPKEPAAFGPPRQRAIAPLASFLSKGSPGWVRNTAQAAAVLAFVVGSALLVKQGLLHSGTPSGQGTPATIGNDTSTVPLSAGARVVYAHDGAVWSAPAAGAGIGQRLSLVGVRVAGWSVSADGQRVAYIDAQTGAIHVVRSDDQSDHVIGSIGATHLSDSFWGGSSGQAISGGLVWSPDGLRIAYLAAGSGDGATTLHMMNADGTNDKALNGAATVMTGTPVWSRDGLRVAFTQTATDGSQGVWSYSADTKALQQLAVRADPEDAAATVAHLAWLPDTVYPAVTWSAADGDAVTGLFTRSITTSTAPRRLTPSATRYAAADFSPAHAGVWVVAGDQQNPSLAEVSARDAGLNDVTSLPSNAQEVVWSPSGDVAAYRTVDGQLGLWSAASGGSAIASGVLAAPVWSPDGTQLAMQTSEGVYNVQVRAGVATQMVRLWQAQGLVTLRWAPDGHELAAASTNTVEIVSADGTRAKMVDAAPALDGGLMWTVAR